MNEPMVVAENLRKVYRQGPREIVALRDVSFEAHPGELVVITGRSGSGKTTLLNQVGGLDRPDAGEVTVAGRRITDLSEGELLQMRREEIGFVFQSFGLIPVLSAAENVGVPMRLTNTPADEREKRVEELLTLVGLADHANQRPYELSGGQRQRVAIARALANRPRLLIADEPTGQLDSQTGRQIMELLRTLALTEDVTALVTTHDPALVGYADRVLTLHDGALLAPQRA
jgi:ABC-type antimicrobial peptide transport system, ATPase component